MSITWSKEWSALDDGSVLTGLQLGTLQSDITNGTVQLSGDQTIAGTKTFTGTVTITGNVVELIKASEFICYDENIVCYESEPVYRR